MAVTHKKAPVYIKNLKLISAPRPSTNVLLNALENMLAEYWMTHFTLPQYLYLNTQLWDEIGASFMPIVEDYGLTVITHKDYPTDRFNIHHDYIPAADLAKWHKGFSDDEGEIAGKLAIV